MAGGEALDVVADVVGLAAGGIGEEGGQKKGGGGGVAGTAAYAVTAGKILCGGCWMRRMRRLRREATSAARASRGRQGGGLRWLR